MTNEELDNAVLQYLRDEYEMDSECANESTEEIASMVEEPNEQLVYESLLRLQQQGKVACLDDEALRNDMQWEAIGAKIHWEDDE